MKETVDESGIESWEYYRRRPQLLAKLPEAWRRSIAEHRAEAAKQLKLRQRRTALSVSMLATFSALTAKEAKSAPTVYTTTLTGTSADTQYPTSTDANGNLVYSFASGDSINTQSTGDSDSYGVYIQTSSPKVILQAGANGNGQLSISTLRPAVDSNGVAIAVDVVGGANLTINGNSTIYAEADDGVPNNNNAYGAAGVSVNGAAVTFNGNTSITTYTPGYSHGLDVYQGQVVFNGDLSISASARGADTDAIYNSGGGQSSIIINGNVTLVSYGLWPSDDVHGIYNNNINTKLTINGNLSLTATSNGSTVMGIRNQGNLTISGNASITASGPRSAFGIDNTFITSRMYVGGDLDVAVQNTSNYTPFGLPQALSNMYGMGSFMTYAGAANVSITAVTDVYALNNNGVVAFTNADKVVTLSAITSCATCDAYGIANSGGSVTLAGGLNVSESTGGTGQTYAIWNVATDGDSAQVTVNQAGNEPVKVDGDVLTGSVTDASSGTVYSGITTLNFDDSSSYLKGLVLGYTQTGATNLSFTQGASWIPTGTGTLANDFGSGSLTIGAGSAIDMAANWGSFAVGSVPSYSLRTLQIGSTASSGATVNLADGAVFTLLSDIRNGQADEVVFGSGIASFTALGTQDIRIAYDPVLDSTSWVNASALQNGVSIAASKPIVIVDASAVGGTGSFQAVKGLTSQWGATYENALVRFSYVPEVSLSSDHKEILLTGIDIIGNGSGTSSSSGSGTSSSGGSGASNSSGTTGTGAGVATTSSGTASTGGTVAITPSTGVQVAGDAALALSNIWQIEEQAVSRHSESLRSGEAPDASALWVDTDGGDFTSGDAGRNYRQSETSVSIGTERQTDFDGGHNAVGLVYTQTQSHASLTNGTADLHGNSLGVYSTWYADQGLYADVVGRVGQLRNSYMSADSFGTTSGRYRARAASLSARVGRRFQDSRGGYIEPQVQAAYGSIGASSYIASNQVHFDVNPDHTFLSRAGVLLGQTVALSSTITGDVYARVSVIHAIGDRPDITASLDGGVVPVALPARHATAGETVIGGRVALGGRWSAFAEAGRTSRNDAVAGGWRAAAGLRMSF